MTQKIAIDRVGPVGGVRRLREMCAAAMIVCIAACASPEAPAPTPQPSPRVTFPVRVLARGGPFIDIASVAASADQKLYVSDRGVPPQSGGQSIFVVDLATGSISTLVSGLPLSVPNEMLIGDGRGPWGTDLVIADHNSDETRTCCNGRVFAVDRRTGSVRVLAVGNPAFPTTGDPSGLALAPPGSLFPYGLYVMDFAGATPNPPVLYRITEDGSAVTFLVNAEVWTVNRGPQQIAFGSSGGFADNLYVSDATSLEQPRRIWRVTPQGEIQRFVEGTSGALDFPPPGPFGTALYVLAGQQILAVRPDGQVSTFLSNLPLTGASGLCFAPNGERLFAGAGDTVIEVTATVTPGK